MTKTGQFISEVLHGKSIGRILLNWKIQEAARDLSGKGLDVAGGNGSYYRFLPAGLSITKTNYQGDGLDATVDLNKALPFQDNEFDFILFFNALYIVEHPLEVLRELRRVLRPGGVLLLSSPFIANEMPEPHDYLRYTAEGLARLCKETSWTRWEVARCGERCTSAASLIGSPLPSLLRLPLYAGALLGDRLLSQKVKTIHPSPISYLCTAIK